MIKKPWVIGCCLACWAIVFLLIAILTPIILSQLLEDNVKDSVKLTSSNGKKLWGELPGDSDCIMYQNYHLFNLLNPEGLLEGEPPNLEDKSGYLYQEYDKFINIGRHKYDGHKIIRFHLLRYEKITHHTEWPSNLTPDDKITTISVGAFGAWDQLKHVSRQQLAISGLYSIINGLETTLAITIYATGVQGFLLSFPVAYLVVFEPSGISKELAEQLWYDPNYGMNNTVNMQVWVQALVENSVNGTFSVPTPITGNLYILWQYFGLTNNQMTLLFNGYFNDAYQLITYMVYVNYECDLYGGEELCDPLYLSAIQWNSSFVTRFPPGGAGATPSIATTNSSTPGFPEIYYYYNATSTETKYPGVYFNQTNYNLLFYYNRTTGWPAYNDSTLLDVGKMNQFFDLSYQGNFSGLANILQLPTENHARVLWDYVNALIDFTALQGRYDPVVYNIQNRGISTEASLGSVGSQTLYSIIVGMSQVLPISITSVYASLQSQAEQFNCPDVVEHILSAKESSICYMYGLSWTSSSNGMALWILTYWNGENSTEWFTFQKLSSLNNTSMQTLFLTSNSLTQTFARYDLTLKTNYNCPNSGLRCDPMYLAKMQWGKGLVTMNLPSIFSSLHIGNSSSIINYDFLSMGLTGTPEYFSYSQKKNAPVLSDNQINYLLSFNGLLCSTQFQLFFIYEYEGSIDIQQQAFNLTQGNVVVDYLRYMIDLYFLGGLIQTKSVNTILWNDTEPLLEMALVTNPLLGGNPSTDLTSTSIGQNMTQDHFEGMGLDFRDGMDTGETHVNNVREYRLYGGQPYINVPMKGYFGQLPNNTGPNLTWYNLNPWSEEVPIGGTDAWSFRPYLSKNDNIQFFLDQGSLVFDSDYIKEVTEREFLCLRYRISNSVLQSAKVNPENTKYYAFGPNGVVNETNVFTAPLFGSKPYFLSADPTLLKLINYSDPSLVVPENYESIFDVEKYSGTVLHVMEQLQYNFELKPDNLYPKLGLYNLQTYGYRTYMPFFFVQRYERLSQHIVDKYFGLIHTVLTVMLAAQIAGYILAGILLILLIIYIWNRKRKARIDSESERGQSLVIK
ncbi:hypothetical protein SteCoe_18453 [Stentor coeruleus]|uniref:CD36 family protein n=1 Tax=Stentor coeruleus TaxID=5963 RepID=A0A1R2BWG9_9CILI|nr:hypothetical protein SteCoe_18453 [Stentor coeruleus]